MTIREERAPFSHLVYLPHGGSLVAHSNSIHSFRFLFFIIIMAFNQLTRCISSLIFPLKSHVRAHTMRMQPNEMRINQGETVNSSCEWMSTYKHTDIPEGRLSYVNIVSRLLITSTSCSTCNRSILLSRTFLSLSSVLHNQVLYYCTCWT